MEHIRPNGLSHGYFCLTCGQVSSMMGHNKGECVPNPYLVNVLIELNKPNPRKQTMFKVGMNVEVISDMAEGWGPSAGTICQVVKVHPDQHVFWITPLKANGTLGSGIFWTTPEDVKLLETATAMTTQTLGQKLAATLDELEKAKIEGLEKQASADREKIRKERLSLTRLKDDTISTLTASIIDGRVPLIKIKDYDRRKWVQEAVKGKAAHQDIWNELTAWARSNALHIKIEDAHDGVGIESWINLTVVPVRPGYRSLKEMEGLGVGDYRG
jgi:hypothetical protein